MGQTERFDSEQKRLSQQGLGAYLQTEERLLQVEGKNQNQKYGRRRDRWKDLVLSLPSLYVNSPRSIITQRGKALLFPLEFPGTKSQLYGEFATPER